MANASILSKTLRIGVDEDLYVAAAGAISATGTAGTGPAYGCFGLPPQCSNYRGSMWLQAVPIGGTVTAATFQIETSLNHGVTWGIVNSLVGVSGGPSTLTGLSGIAFGTLATGAVIRIDVSGLGGNGCLRLNFTTLTLGTGTGANIYAHLG
jgi:hypothetical protein